MYRFWYIQARHGIPGSDGLSLFAARHDVVGLCGLAGCVAGRAAARRGEFTWFGLRLYSARLWAAGPVQDWSQPFALELTYHRSLSRDTLVQASLQEMRRLGGGSVTDRQISAWSDTMAAAFVDVRPGMRITGVYCRFYVDGRLAREVADPAFARAFFAIWLDPRARDPQLRQRLLGLADDDRGN